MEPHSLYINTVADLKGVNIVARQRKNMIKIEKMSTEIGITFNIIGEIGMNWGYKNALNPHPKEEISILF